MRTNRQKKQQEQLQRDVKARDILIGKYASTINKLSKILKSQAKVISKQNKILAKKDTIIDRQTKAIKVQIVLLEQQDTTVTQQTERIKSLIKNIEYHHKQEEDSNLWISLLPISRAGTPEEVMVDTDIYVEGFKRRFKPSENKEKVYGC